MNIINQFYVRVNKVDFATASIIYLKSFKWLCKLNFMYWVCTLFLQKHTLMSNTFGATRTDGTSNDVNLCILVNNWTDFDGTVTNGQANLCERDKLQNKSSILKTTALTVAMTGRKDTTG